MARRLGAGDFGGRGVVGQIEGHQRLECRSSRYRVQNPRPIKRRLFGRRHRRSQVGHDDGAGELAGAVWHDRAQRRTVADVQMPVVGAGEGEGVHAGFRLA